MNMDQLKNEIRKTGYLEDNKIGSYFHMKYKSLYDEICKHTDGLKTTYRINLTLRSRVKFIFDYDCDLKSLIKDGKYFIFNRRLDKFIINSNNSAKSGWDRINLDMTSQTIYDLSETKSKLLEMSDYQIFGRGKNRSLCSKNPKLYSSILSHSKSLDIFDRNTNKFPSKIIFIRDYDANLEKLSCKKCNSAYVLYNPQKNYFNDVCKKCYYETDDFYPQKGYFKKKYGDEWEYYYLLDRENIKNKKVNSCEWFIKKYGYKDGEVKYKNYVNKKIQNILNLSSSSYSKISQELFWGVYSNLSNDEKEKCFFMELNKEIFININGKIHIPDFVYKNKIIEYDGSYWHNVEKDSVRNEFYKKNGYDVLIITDKDFNRQNKPKEIIDKCLKFLRVESK